MSFSLEEISSDQYGSSTSYCDYILEKLLITIGPKSIVDFGAGGGKNGRIIRRTLGGDPEVIAVEGYKPTHSSLVSDSAYDRADLARLEDWLESNEKTYDLAIFGDVLEHIDPAAIRRTLRSASNVFSNIIVVCPLHDIFQGASYGNELEIHRSYITQGFFDNWSPKEKHIVKGRRYTIMLVYLKPEPKPSISHRVAWRALHISIIVLQPLGLARRFVLLLQRHLSRFKWLIR